MSGCRATSPSDPDPPPADSLLPPALRAGCPIGDVAPPRGQRDSERRLRILIAATEVFGERGLRGVTSDDLAAAANVSVGTIYLYFDDKLDCLLAAYDRLVSRTCELLSARLSPQASQTELVNVALGAVHELLATEPHAARLAFFVVRTAGPEGVARHREILTEAAAVLHRARSSQSEQLIPANFEDVEVAAAAALLAEAFSGLELPEPAALMPDLRALLLAAAGEEHALPPGSPPPEPAATKAAGCR
jgi:AcrR family transcriptional regulator